MKKKKNRNIKMTIAAGLLITPAIVAQAGEVQASTNAEVVLTLFNNLNETNLSTLQTRANELVALKLEDNTDGQALKALDANLLELIEAKITYLQSYVDHKKTAEGLKSRMDKLSTSSGTFATDYAQITADLAALKVAFKSSLTSLSGAPVVAETYQTNLLKDLKYYDKGANLAADTDLFSTAIIGETTLEGFKEKGKLLANAQTVIDGPVAELVQVFQDISSTKQAITDKAAAVEAVITPLHSGEKIIINAYKVTIGTDGQAVQVSVKDLLANLESGFTNAEKVLTDIKVLLVSTPTSTTLSNKIKTIETTYDKVPTYLKRFVDDYDSQLPKIKAALEATQSIDLVLKKTTEISSILEEIEGIETIYNELGSMVYKGLVTNYSKLQAFKTTLQSVSELETALADTTTTHTVEKIAEFIAVFNEIATTNYKYFTKENLALLKGWTTNVKSADTVGLKIEKLSTANLATIANATDSKKLSTTKSFINSINSVYKEYDKIPQLETSFNPRTLVKERARLEGLKEIVTITEKVIALTPVTARNQEILTDVTEALNSFSNKAEKLIVDSPNLTHLGTYLTDFVAVIQSDNKIVDELIVEITALEQDASLLKITSIRDRYNKLSTASQILVSNYKQFTALEKMYKAAVTVTSQIDQLDPKAKDFARKTTAAQTAHNKLTTTLQELVYNKDKLVELAPIAQLMIDIDALRPTAADFKTKLSTLQGEYDKLLPSEPSAKPADDAGYKPLAEYRLFNEYKSKLATHQSTISTAAAIEAKIGALKSKTGEQFMNDLKAVSDEYKKLDSTTKRSVSNAKVLTELERDYQASLRVIDQIEKLPAHTDRNFASKVVAAQKAYERLTDNQKKNVYNYASKLQTVEKAAKLIERLEKLRIGSKTYEVDVKSIREDFGKLSTTEQALVHNISKLTGAEQSVVNAVKVMELIDLATPTVEAYIDKLTAARAAYDSLEKTDQKLVLNYKDLTTRERTVKPVLKLDADILALDPSSAKTFISKFKAADKAYEKLTIAERGLLLNADKLTGEMTLLYNVIDTINTIKNSSKTFVEDTKHARSLYESLSGDLKAKVSNYDLLRDHERNVEGGKAVDAMIQALNSSEPKEFITKVKEARAAFKSLSAANKKAVTLEVELKEQEKYIKPVEAAIKAIADLSDPRKDLSRQFTTVNKALQKLDATQMTFVSNIDKYSNLSNVIYAYTLIAALKPNDKYYQGNIEAAKTAYEKLSEEEKVKVTNYYKLQEAILDMTEVQKVTSLIASLNASSSNFFADIEKTLAAYKTLPSGSRKQVLNYATLQQAEKDMKEAQRVIKQIDDLDPELRTYASRAKSAKTAYERLTTTQKALVNNYNRLQAAVFELGL